MEPIGDGLVFRGLPVNADRIRPERQPRKGYDTRAVSAAACNPYLGKVLADFAVNPASESSRRALICSLHPSARRSIFRPSR
jgi:hypothetical protein